MYSCLNSWWIDSRPWHIWKKKSTIKHAGLKIEYMSNFVITRISIIFVNNLSNTMINSKPSRQSEVLIRIKFTKNIVWRITTFSLSSRLRIKNTYLLQFLSIYMVKYAKARQLLKLETLLQLLFNICT